MIAVARLLGAAAGAFAGLVAVQLMRMRRMEFLPAWPGFAINHIIDPSTGEPTRPGRLNIVVLGDSTTAGVGVSRPEDSLPYLLAQRAADAEMRPVKVVSRGWAGARVADLPGTRYRMPPRRRAAITAGHSSRRPISSRW